MSTKDRSLRLAGTIALNMRQMSPQSKIRERKGFVTATRVPDNFDYKNDKAIDEMYKVTKKTGEKTLITKEY
jgi:hypothetical protein